MATQHPDPREQENTRQAARRSGGGGGRNRGEQEKARGQTGQDADDERKAAGVRNANIHPGQR